MWMMGCNDGGGFNMSTDTFNGSRKLRPLIPRPSSSSSVTTPTSTVTTPTPTTYSNITSTTATTINSTSNISTSHHHYHPPVLPSPPPPPPPSSCYKNLHHTEIFLLNNHLSMVSEQNKRDLQIGGSGTTSTTTTTTVVNSRWNPTPEQLRTLEELYRRGTRTPSADQIQHITAQLRRYGKIEGKNVFYWFQNHKARERQKRRRRSEYIDLEEKHQQQQQFEIDLQRNESGSSRTVYEVQQTKNWSLPTNCSTTNTTLSQEPVSMQEAIVAVGAVESGMKTDGWIELEDRELQHNNNRGPPHPIDTHATWQMMNLSCSSSLHPNLNIFISSSSPPPQNKERFYHQEKFDHQKSHTLELFPLRNIENNEEKINGGGDHHHHLMIRKEITTHELLPVTTMNNSNSTTTTNFNTAPCKFFEFL